MRLAAARASLRIARRDALRARGRSALVLLMIALPVLGMTSADVLYRTAQLDADETIARDLGRADVTLRAGFGGPIRQSLDGDRIAGFGDIAGSSTVEQRPPSDGEVVANLPTAVRSISRALTGASVLTRSGGQRRVDWISFDYADPLVTGTIEQRAGRSPRATDEIALSTALATSLAVDVGDRVESAGRTYAVVGTVVDPHSLGLRSIYGLPGSAPEPDAGQLVDRIFVKTSEPVTWRQVLALNDAGIVAVSRSVLLDPPPVSEQPLHDPGYERNVRLAVAGVVVLVVGLATLEVVLLAGAAFAVGARRQRRSLALVAASGGEKRHVRAVVLAGGLVLGACGAVVGVVAGVAVSALVLDWFATAQDRLLGRFDVRPLELLGIACIGAVTGLLAAVVPARGAARADVVAVLAGRAGIRRTPLRVPLAGVIAAGAGVALAAVGSAADTALNSARLILVGTVLVQLGTLVLTPAIVGAAGRLGRRLPLTSRLALRDAARHRGRTAPAVGAVMAAVAGSTALTVYLVSEASFAERTYLPASRVGTAVVQLDTDDDAVAERARRIAAAALPTRDAVVARTLGCNVDYNSDCTDVVELVLPPAVQLGGGDQPFQHSGAFNGPLVGDARLLRALLGRSDRELEAALERGTVLVPARGAVQDGRVQLRTVELDSGNQRELTSLPAVQVAEIPGVSSALIPSSVADQLGLQSRPIGIVVDTTRMPTEDEEESARAELQGLQLPAFIGVERGAEPRQSGVLLALLVGTTVITLGASGVATGLAAADGRADMATLAAVGAGPCTRRRLAGAQALTVAALGTVFGVAVGFVPAVAYISRLPGYTVEVPWIRLVALVVGVPLSAMGLASALTRSRLPMVRRAG